MEERKGFGSNFGFLMAAVGSAVGLGNIWGFPYKMGANGGFTFLLVYIFLGVTCGFIVMISELAMGRKTGKGAVEAYKIVSKKFKWMGWLGILSAFFILFFYCALGGYCIKYTVLNVGDLFGAGFGSAGRTGAEIFTDFMAAPTEAIIYGLIFVALTMIIVMGGIGGGIEKVCSVGMPALFIALLICIIRSCTLPNAVDGIVTGCILAVGRIVGESAALLYTAGFGLVLNNFVTALESSSATLTVALYVYASERGETDIAFAIATILMLLTLVINLSANLVGRKLKKN